MKEEIFNTYVTKVAEIFKIEEEEVFGGSKKRKFSDARQLLYYLCSVRPIRIVHIKGFMNERGLSVSHQSILHGVKSVKKKLSTDRDYKLTIKKLEDV
jgi:chromosomal replication initiation ATPase DnaA|tara:strand:+ start:792 stop:1085 length:294 start_codon:yes stop_codon:yes gene_type:complete